MAIADQLPFADPIIREARARFDRVAEWEGSWRPRFINDVKFAEGDSENGYQWKESIRRNRDVDNRPCLTMNIVRQHNFQISNSMRQNKSEIKALATGNDATAAAAQIYSDLIRYTQAVSNAQDVFTIARKFQVDAGRGWWRLVTQYASADSFDQDVRILPVIDPLSVYMDPDIQQKDGSDANWAFVFDDLPIDIWKEQYPYLVELGRQPLGVASMDDDWISKDHIRVCEYFRKVTTRDTLISFVHLGERKSILKSNLPGDVAEELIAKANSRTRPVDVPKIEWYLIAGDTVVDQTIWPGSYIPLIRCVGEESVIDGIYDCKGHTRNLKDAQRMYNWNAALDVETPIPTPNGWIKMGEIKEGDLVYRPDGMVTPVKKALPIRYGEDCFKITFDSGYSVVTDGGHIWEVEERGKRKSATYEWNKKTINTAELLAGKHFIKTTAPLVGLAKELPVDPYLLGLWLGDGHTSSGRMSAHVDDAEEEKSLIAELGFQCGPNAKNNGLGTAFTVYGLRGKLHALGVLDSKFVPREYFRAEISQRLGLLQGLMDSDGNYDPSNNRCTFVNVSKKLATAMLELLASLGVKATLAKQPEKVDVFPSGKEYISKANYRITFTADPDLPVFRLKRKAQQQTQSRPTHWRRTKRHGIKSVEQVESRPVRCIELDTPDHLYLCGKGMVPTHNSAEVEFVSMQGKTPWLAPAKAIEELESMWNTANVANHSVLVWNHVDDQNPDVQIPPPIRIDPPNFSAAYEKAMDTAFNQLMMASGQWQNQMGMMGNERTGAAIGKRMQQGDVATYHFQDNYEIALRYTGTQLLDLFPKIMDTKRVMMVLSETGESAELVVDPTAKQALQMQIAEDGTVVQRIFNPQIGRYAIAPSVGPAYGSRREEAVEKLAVMLSEAPQLIPIIGDLMISEMDFDKAQEAAQRLRRMVPPQALGLGPSQSEQQLQGKIQGLTASLAESLNDQAKQELQLVGKDQMRDIDAYKAETERLKALQKDLPGDQGGLAALVQQTVREALEGSLGPVFAANANDLDIDGAAPMAGARKAPDGQWYVGEPGAYVRVAKRAGVPK